MSLLFFSILCRDSFCYHDDTKRNMSLRKHTGCFTWPQCLEHEPARGHRPQASPPTLLTSSQSLHFYIYFTLQITCKHFKEQKPCGGRYPRLAHPQTTSWADANQAGRDCFIFKVLISVRKKSAWILKVSLLLAYFFIVNIYILLTRWWRELFFFFFVKMSYSVT